MHEVHGMVSIELFQRDLHSKPYARLTFPNGTIERVTCNIGEMAFGALTGARRRWEDLVGTGELAYPPEPEPRKDN
jgi:hypothetical protein